MKKQLITTLTALIIASSQALPAAQSVTAPLPETAITASAVNYAPAKVTGVKASKTGYTSTVLSWKKVSNAKGYRVYMYDPNVGKYRKMTTINKNSTTSYTVVQIEPGKTHKFKVRAYRKVGGKTYWGTSSAALSVTTKSYAPAKVTGLKANANSQTAGTLTWKKIAGATGYRVYVYNTSTKKYTKVTTLSGNTKTSCKVTGLKAGTSYKYKVRAYRKADGRTYWGTSSAAVTLTTKQDALYAAYESILRGDSTAQQRELIRQDLIAYVLEQEPSFILDESLYAYADANGNPTHNVDIATAWGNSGFDFGAIADVEMSLYHMNILGNAPKDLSLPSQDECVKRVQKLFRGRVDGTIENYREGLRSIERFNISLEYSYHSCVEDNTGLILPCYCLNMLVV